MPDLTEALAIVDEEQGTAPKPRRRRPFRLKLDRDEVVTKVLEEFTLADNARDAWRENHARWLAKYLGQIERDEGGSTPIHIPVVMYHVQRTAAGLVSAVLGGGRVVRAMARNRAFLKRQETVTEFLNYQLLHDLNLEETLDKLAVDFLVHGKFIVKVPWVTKKETTRVFHKFDADTPPEQVLEQLYPGITDTMQDSKNEFLWKVKRPAAGTERDVTLTDEVEFFPADDRTDVVVTGEETTYENPMVVRKRLEDVVVPNPDTLQELRKAAWIIDRSWITVDEVKRLHRDGIYDLLTDEDMEAVEQWGSHEKNELRDVKGVRDVVAGQQGVEPRSDETGTRTGLTVLEYYGWWDVNDDGFKERVIFWVIEELKLLARAKYLSEVYRDNEWPYAEAGFIQTEGFYQMGVPELAEGLQDAIVMLHNQGLEWGLITSAPFGFYRPSSGMKPETIRYQPGELIPLDNPKEDVVFPQFPTAQQQWRFNEEALLNQYLDRTLAQGPVQFGQPPEGRASAVRTARATLALIGQSDLLADLTLRRFYRGVQRLFYLVWRRDKEFLPPGRAFRIVGAADPAQDPFRTLQSREELAGDYDFELIGTNFTANRDSIRQTILLIFQTLLNPLTLQTGIVGVRNIYEIAKELLLSLDRKDFDRFISKPAAASAEPPKEPQEEHDMMMNGIPARVNPNEDIQGHLQAHMEFVMSDSFGSVPAHYVPLFKAHLQETMQAAQMFQQAQASQAGAAEQTQSQLAGNPAVQGALQMGFGSQPQAVGFPAPGSLGGGDGKVRPSGP